MAHVTIGSARIDERGKAHGGKAGDQKNEVSRQAWYKHSKGWVLLRCRDPAMRGYIADAMDAACDNSRIGYDQYQRLTLYDQVKDRLFDPAKADAPCETDCSALVRVCVLYAAHKAGVGVELPDFTTPNEASRLTATGLFEKITDSKYTAKDDCLRRGDILVTKTQGHTVVVLTDGSKADSDDPLKPLTLGDRELSHGMAGADVMELQSRLLELGFNLPKYGADGEFGPETKSAVVYFQTERHLDPDGIVGPLTLAELLDSAPDDEANAVLVPVNPLTTPPSRKTWLYDAFDLSSYNSTNFANIDWGFIKNNVGFLILRAGCTRLKKEPKGIGPDNYFKKYAQKCAEYRIPFWAYYYSHSNTIAECRKEAEYLWKVAHEFHPVGYALDCEEKGIKVAAFFARIGELEECTKTMLYIGHNWYSVYKLPVDDKGFIKCCDAVWIPRYGKNDGTAETKYLPKYPCDLWQFSSVVSLGVAVPDKTLDANKITGQRHDMAWFRGES